MIGGLKPAGRHRRIVALIKQVPTEDVLNKGDTATEGIEITQKNGKG